MILVLTNSGYYIYGVSEVMLIDKSCPHHNSVCVMNGPVANTYYCYDCKSYFQLLK
jgi:hypothetical protein